mmetsp:Transcript_31165/g.98965  ORF Transcript_31165/g.98965 Transcript_31165/m.98965 type:complete len:306 (-) Transcript_31165:591-1508(-)
MSARHFSASWRSRSSSSRRACSRMAICFSSSVLLSWASRLRFSAASRSICRPFCSSAASLRSCSSSRMRSMASRSRLALICSCRPACTISMSRLRASVCARSSASRFSHTRFSSRSRMASTSESSCASLIMSSLRCSVYSRVALISNWRFACSSAMRLRSCSMPYCSSSRSCCRSSAARSWRMFSLASLNARTSRPRACASSVRRRCSSSSRWMAAASSVSSSSASFLMLSMSCRRRSPLMRTCSSRSRLQASFASCRACASAISRSSSTFMRPRHSSANLAASILSVTFLVSLKSSSLLRAAVT